MKKYSSISKNLFGLALFLGSTTMVVAQNDVAMVTHSNKTLSLAMSETANTNSSEYLRLSETKDAVKQIRQHIEAHLDYPALLNEYDISGAVTIEVNIESDGTIGKTYMVKGMTKAIDQKVIAVTKSIEKINISGLAYRGINTVHIPIRFTNTF